MATDSTLKKQPPERRASRRLVAGVDAGAATELSWEDKVLKRVGGHVARLAETTCQLQPDEVMGWEAAGFNVLKNHTEASEEKAKE